MNKQYSNCKRSVQRTARKATEILMAEIGQEAAPSARQVTRASPFKGAGYLLIVVLECEQMFLRLGEVLEFIGCQGLALDNREVYLYLVKPACMHGGYGSGRRLDTTLSGVEPKPRLDAKIRCL